MPYQSPKKLTVVRKQQEDEEDFEHLTDEDEFEGFDREQTTKSKSHDHQPPDLKIATVSLISFKMIYKHINAHVSK